MSKGSQFIEQLARQVSQEINVCLIGQILTYNEINGKCSIKPLHKSFINGQSVDLPVLVDVPMFQLGTSEFNIRMSFKPGDIIPVIIADYDIGNLVLTGENRNPNTNDIHNLNDAIALPVILNAFQSDLPSNDPGDLTIQKKSGSTKIVLKADSDEVIIESSIIRLGENATKNVKLADDTTTTKVFAE